MDNEQKMLQITLNSATLKKINSLLSLNAEYIDLVTSNNQCILAIETKGFLFAVQLGMLEAVPPTNLRLPVQILRQLKSGITQMRIALEPQEISVFLFKQDLTEKPIKITVRRSISNLGNYSLLRDMFEDNNLGADSLFAKCVPVLAEVYQSVSGFKVKDFLINDGVVFIDNNQVQFFTNIYVDKVNLSIPEIVLKAFARERLTNIRYILRDGYHCVCINGSIYAWKAIRVLPVNSYSILKSLQPKALYTACVGNALDFIRNLKLADNREQECYIDFDKSQIVVNENDIIKYDLPIESKLRAGEPAGALKLPIKELLELLKDIDKYSLMFKIYPKFIEVFTQKQINGFGQIESSYVIRLLK